MWRENWNKNKADTQKYETTNTTRLEWSEFIDKLPDTLPEPLDLGIIGGLVLNGFTNHDIDWHFPVNTNWDDIRNYKIPLDELAQELFNKPSHVGNIIAELSPTPKRIQLYNKGVLRNRAELKALVTVSPTKIKRIRKAEADILARLDNIEKILNINV